MAKTRWGVLGTSKFARGKVIPALKHCQWCDVQAIASRNLESAQRAASELDIPKAYGSYEELLADPGLDVIYNPLPNHLHVEWSIKALESGKHVLCEKPIGLTVSEGQQLADAAKAHPSLKVMEGFMYRHHPQWQKAKDIAGDGGIGDFRLIQSIFTYHNTDPANVRNRADIGGGGLMDIGCYNISLSRFIFDSEPLQVCGTMEFDATFQVDRLASAIMQFENGISTFACATQLNSYQRVNILGTEGRVEIEIPFNAPPDKPCKIWHQHGEAIEEIVFEVCDQYTIQGDLFARAVLEDTAVPTPIEDAVSNMKALEAIKHSAQKQTWIKL